MKRHKLGKGQRLMIGERAYVVARELSSEKLQLMEEATNMYSERSVESLIALFSEGSLKLLHDPSTETYANKKIGQMLEADISLLSEKTRAQMQRRLEYVAGATKEGLISRTTKAFLPIIEKTSRLIGDPAPPSASQVYRWYRDYMDSGKSIRALIPQTERRGNRQPRMSTEVSDIVNSMINENYLSSKRLSITAVYDSVVAEMGRRNRLRIVEDQMRIPSYGTVYSHIKGLDPYEVMKSRYGKLAADRLYRPMQKGPTPTYPLERVEFDHTKLDLFVVDMERKMPIGRPWLTSAIDTYSRCILGIYVSFTPPSYLSVMKCLLNSIKPKGYVKKQFEGIKNSWDTYGLMDTAVVDNGKEFWSTHFEDACLQLGIAVQYAPVKLAWYKAIVERHFRTLNTELLHRQPGTTFSNVIDRGEYDPKKNAIIPLLALQWAIHKWIIDVYHQDKHGGLKSIPSIAWKKGIEVYPPAMPSSMSELSVMIGMTAERTITKSGIEFEGLFYNDDSLLKLRREAKRDGKVRIKYDPEDLSMIYVEDRDRKSFVPVQAVDREYTQALTLWQHQVTKRYARNHIKENYDMVDLCIAKAEIQEEVLKEWGNTRKSGTRVKMARWLGPAAEGYGQIESSAGQGTERVSIGRDCKDQNVHIDPSLHYANGIAAVGQEVVGGRPPEEYMYTATDNSKNIMMKQGKEGTMRKQGKAGKKIAAEAKGKAVKRSKVKKAALKRKENYPKGEVEGKALCSLDLTGWDIGYMN